jgi:hypothetical protein
MADDKGLAVRHDEEVLRIPVAIGDGLGRHVLVELVQVAQELGLVNHVEDGAEVELGRVEEEDGVVEWRQVGHIRSLVRADRPPAELEGATVRVRRVDGDRQLLAQKGQDAPAEGP